MTISIVGVFSTPEEAAEIRRIVKHVLVGQRAQELSRNFRLRQIADKIIEEEKQNEKKKGA